MTTTLQTALTTATTATSSATLVAGKHTPVDATSGAKTMTLPTPATIGARLRVEKADVSTNKVTVSGTIRGSASTVSLDWQYETLEFVAESLTSWRPSADHKPKAGLTRDFTKNGEGHPAIAAWFRKPPELRYLVGLGDSHMDENTGAGGAQVWGTQLRTVETLPGRPLEGMVGANIINGGNNGLSLNGWLANSGGVYTYANLQTDYATAEAAGGKLLIAALWGNNDLRIKVDLLGVTGSAEMQLMADYVTFLTNVRRDMPNAIVVVITPPGATTDNVTSLNFITSNSGTINPAGGAQAFTDSLRRVAWAMHGLYPNVVVWDQQTALFGRKSLASTATNTFANQIHQQTNMYTRRAIEFARWLKSMAGAAAGAVGYPYPSLGYGSRTGGAPDGVTGVSLTPWTVDPRSLEDTTRFDEVGAGYKGSGTLATGSQAIVFGPRLRDLAPYDILQVSAIVGGVGVTEAIQITTTPTTQSNGGPVTDNVVTVTIPSTLNGATTWRVRVFRDRNGGNALIAALLDPQQHANGAVVPLRLTAGSSGLADFTLHPATVDAPGSAAAAINPSLDTLLFADGTSFTLATANSGGLTGLRFNTPHVRLVIAGTDFSTKVGQLAVVYGAHPPRTWQRRTVVAVDPPSIAAGAIGSVDVTVSGLNARNSNTGGTVNDAGLLDAYPARAIPPTSLEAGLLFVACYPVGTDTLRVVLANTTAGAIDGASRLWQFLAG